MTNSNPQSDLPLRRRLWEAWRRNQLILLHLPVLLCLLFGGYAVLKGVDSRIGVEGFGDLFGYMLNSIRAVAVIFTAWWMKKWLWFDLHDQTELDLFKEMRGKSWEDARSTYWIVVRDRAEWVAALAFATYWFTR